MRQIATFVARPPVAPILIHDAVVHFDRPLIMGVLNVTPDSFSDGGHHATTAQALAHAQRLIGEGADFIDIGGESTRPGAGPVTLEEELERVVPVIELLGGSDSWLSIDTYKARVAEAALDAGAHVINDISGFGFDANMPALAADRGAPVVLMHIRGKPKTMQDDIHYDDVIDEIKAFFERRIELAVSAGCDASQIILDPGIGFGKTTAQNYEILRRLPEIVAIGQPVLLGTSRKSFLGAVVNKDPADRVFATAASVAIGVALGADILRVHDVAEMRDVLKVTEATLHGPS